MTYRKAFLSLLAVSAVALPGLSAHAAGLKVDDTALCNAALSLKSKEDGLLMKESVDLIRAASWYAAEGAKLDKVKYDRQRTVYGAAFVEARDKDDPQYEAAVKGCMTRYKNEIAK
jgi:hypothetical protein